MVRPSAAAPTAAVTMSMLIMIMMTMAFLVVPSLAWLHPSRADGAMIQQYPPTRPHGSAPNAVQSHRRSGPASRRTQAMRPGSNTMQLLGPVLSRPGWDTTTPPLSVRDELGCSPTLSVLADGARAVFRLVPLPVNVADADAGGRGGQRPRQRRQGQGRQTQQQRRGDSQSKETDGYGGDGGFFFDPLGLAQDDNFARYREAELKHGRVAMVSVVACVVTTWWPSDDGTGGTGGADLGGAAFLSWLRQWWLESGTQQLLPLSPVAGSPPGVSHGGPQDFVALITTAAAHLLPLPSPLALLGGWTPWDYGRTILLCGIMEAFVWIQVDVQAMPGDYGVGYWGIRDKGRNERSLVCELENGRLAMMVMLLYAVADIWNLYDTWMLETIGPSGGAGEQM